MDRFAALRALIERAESADDAAEQAAALAELQRASGMALRDAVRQAREGGVPWRSLAADLQIAVTTLRDRVMAGREVVARSARNTVPGPGLDVFLGREHEVEAVRDLLERHRLVTLTGTGGIGKTRLAAEFAHRYAHGFDQVTWVELGPLAAGSDVDDAVGAVLDGGLTSGPAVLVLDNCEHVLDGCVRLVTALLADQESLLVLATSREPLGLAGEQIVPVRPLPIDLAVALFFDRARATGHRFDVDGDVVEELCAHLDGMPLAIELAARQVTMLSPEALASFLDLRFTLLAGGRRTALPHQQSLLATIRWSYDLLSDTEQTVFRRLTLFRAGFDRVDAAAMCPELSERELWDTVYALTAKSLLVADSGRFRVLESLRLFGSEELVRRGEWDAVVDRFVEHMGGFCPVTRPPEGMSGAQRWALRRKHWLNLEHALALAPRTGALTYAMLVGALAQARRQVFAGRDSRALVEEAVATQSSARGRLVLLLVLASDHSCTGEYEEARRLGRRAVLMAKHLGDSWLEYYATYVEMSACGRMRDEEGVNRLLPVMVESARATGDPLLIADTLVEVGYELLQRGRLDEADEAVQEGLGLSAHLFSPFTVCNLLTTAGAIELERGDRERAAAYFALTVRADDPSGQVDALQGMAMALCAEQPELALRLFGASGAVSTVGADVGSPWWNERCGNALAKACAVVGSTRAKAVLAEGASLTLAEAAECALAEPSVLTEQETAVATLVADGLDNRAIALRLGLSVRTVVAHLGAVKAKLGLSTRQEIVAWVTEGR